MGLYRVYAARPITDPEDGRSIADTCDTPGFAKPPSSSHSTITNFFAPFLNATTYRLINWLYNGSSTKSTAQLQLLVDDVLKADDFNVADLKDFSAKRETDRLDTYEAATNAPFPEADGWHESTVKIRLPCDKVKCPEDDAPELEISGVFHRKLLDVVTGGFEKATDFHTEPYKMYFKPTDASPAVRCYGENYTSDAYWEEQAKLRDQPRNGCELPWVIGSILLYSDSTHLASFGSASLWPIYLFFGNVSKYFRAMPTSNSAHHLAYIPSVSKHILVVFTHSF